MSERGAESTGYGGAVRFIVITTPQCDVSRAIDEARQAVCTVGRSTSSLAYPPHVTLRTGALVPRPRVGAFLDSFADVVGELEPFPIRTDGLWRTSYRDRDREKYLVGYRVRKDEPLAALNERLLRCVAWRASNRLHFEPHLTLAFDDLDLDGFVRIGHWLNENPGALPAAFTWMCDNVGLYRKDGDAWIPYKVWRAQEAARTRT